MQRCCACAQLQRALGALNTAVLISVAGRELAQLLARQAVAAQQPCQQLRLRASLHVLKSEVHIEVLQLSSHDH